ncbi:MAG TPA: cupin domain-containing protein [Acidimicrobiales bacterium]|jgi:quercetin dioxygenase-like cupin family protein|nr:cupin domain-containing protein [Acidimicrobiales bacterium]
MSQSIARKSDEGDAVWLLGGLYETLVAGDESAGTATVMRISVPAGAGAPPHTHPGDEALYVLAGEVTVHIDDEAVSASPGASFFFPAGTREFWEAQTDATVLATYLPGGIDMFFAEVGEHALSRTLPPPADAPPDFERIVATAARYGMNIEAPGSH